MYRFGLVYKNGIGVKKDPAEAKKWLELAAEAGNEDAKKELAKK